MVLLRNHYNKKPRSGTFTPNSYCIFPAALHRLFQKVSGRRAIFDLTKAYRLC